MPSCLSLKNGKENSRITVPPASTVPHSRRSRLTTRAICHFARSVSRILALASLSPLFPHEDESTRRACVDGRTGEVAWQTPPVVAALRIQLVAMAVTMVAMARERRRWRRESLSFTVIHHGPPRTCARTPMHARPVRREMHSHASGRVEPPRGVRGGGDLQSAIGGYRVRARRTIPIHMKRMAIIDAVLRGPGRSGSNVVLNTPPPRG